MSLKKSLSDEKFFRPTKHPKVLIEQLKRQKKSFYVRETSNISQIIVDGAEINYVKKSDNPLFPPSQLFIFKMVNDDARRWASMNPDFQGNVKFPTNTYNFDYDLEHGEITGTDIASAYWYIAHKIGLISNRTFLKLLPPKYKTTKLASLAVLGRQMVFDVYEEGKKLPEKAVLQEKNQALIDVYRHVRYECYRHMIEMARYLGRDFLCYKTDCIYYRDTAKNRKIVYDYLDSEGLDYNQVIYDEENKEQNAIDILKNNNE